MSAPPPWLLLAVALATFAVTALGANTVSANALWDSPPWDVNRLVTATGSGTAPLRLSVRCQGSERVTLRALVLKYSPPSPRLSIGVQGSVPDLWDVGSAGVAREWSWSGQDSPEVALANGDNTVEIHSLGTDTPYLQRLQISRGKAKCSFTVTSKDEMSAADAVVAPPWTVRRYAEREGSVFSPRACAVGDDKCHGAFRLFLSCSQAVTARLTALFLAPIVSGAQAKEVAVKVGSMPWESWYLGQANDWTQSAQYVAPVAAGTHIVLVGGTDPGMRVAEITVDSTLCTLSSTTAPPAPQAPTLAPPTASPPTPIPPTASPPTPIPPTASPPTPIPPTASPPTPIPPTASPPTPIPPTSSPPTPIPPTASPPTPIPPTSSPPTPIPPTSSPPTPIPPTASPSTPIPPTSSPSTPIPPTASPSTPIPPTASPSTPTPPVLPTPSTLTSPPSLPTSTTVAATSTVTVAGPLPPTIPLVLPDTVLTAAGGVMVVAVLASGPGAGGMLKANTLSHMCSSSEVLPWVLHPTGLSVSGSVYLGCLVSNFAIVTATCLLHSIIASYVSKWKGESLANAQGLVYFPGGTLLLFMVLLQGTVKSAVSLLLYHHSSTIRGVAVVALVFAVWVAMWTYLSLRKVHRHVTFVTHTPPSRCVGWLVGNGEWVPRRDSNDPFLLRFGSLFRCYRPKCVRYAVVDSFLMFGFAAVAAVQADCRPLLITDGTLLTLNALLVAVVRPFHRPINNLLDPTALLLLALSHYTSMESFFLAGIVTLGLRCALDIGYFVYSLRTKRCQNLATQHDKEDWLRELEIIASSGDCQGEGGAAQYGDAFSYLSSTYTPYSGVTSDRRLSVPLTLSFQDRRHSLYDTPPIGSLKAWSPRRPSVPL